MAGTNDKDKLPQEGRTQEEGGGEKKGRDGTKEEIEKEKYERELLEEQRRRKSIVRSPIQVERLQAPERMEGVEHSIIPSEEGEGNKGEDEGESEAEREKREEK
ncbi:hypothetical protein J6590_028781 [Homalodisca vitripennis]|nr:hypothetical protein J6590_028781 [Homalodisca vitripennis]